MMKNESGRSMVEMLGVLAIIGVLSVGGIAGYTMAMNKYKANEVVAAASQCAIVARAANGGEGTNACADVKYKKADGKEADFSVTKNSDGTYTVANSSGNTLTSGVCKAMNAIKTGACTSDANGTFSIIFS